MEIDFSFWLSGCEQNNQENANKDGKIEKAFNVEIRDSD